jgi:hypothetical protein
VLSDTRARTALIIVAFAALSIAMTWPLSRPFAGLLPDSDDAYFSVWRISWVAHQLAADPAHLFDANVFYPEKNTLAFSDAMLLVGVLATPLLWAGADPVIVHNALLIIALFTSAVAAYFLARRLGASPAGGVIAGLIFGFAPYRFAHIAHLELQWMVWMPLAMLALHRVAERPGILNALLLGACVAAQFFSSIYYGVFLAMCLAIAVVIFFVRSSTRASFAVAAIVALLPLLLVVIVYGRPYGETRAAYGGRSADEQQRYSAIASDFLRVPPYNALRGRPDPAAAEERTLYPGAVPIVLAAAALLPPVGSTTVVYAVLSAVAIEGALGTHGFLFPAMQRIAPGVSSLRSPARFGAPMLLFVAMLAAKGMTRVNTRWPASRTIVTLAAIAICLIEYWSAPIPVRAFNGRASEATQYLAAQPAGSVVLELPVPTPGALWLYETTYQARSIHHWQPLINGYSAFAPERYQQTLDVLRTFPSEQSLSYLRNRGVKFIVINRAYYPDADQLTAMERTLSEQEQQLWPLRTFGSGDSRVVIAEFKPR